VRSLSKEAHTDERPLRIDDTATSIRYFSRLVERRLSLDEILLTRFTGIDDGNDEDPVSVAGRLPPKWLVA